MAEYVNTDAIVRNRIQYAKDFNYFKKLFILQKLTREEYARFLDALHKKNIMDLWLIAFPLFLMCFLPSVAFDTDYELIFFEVGFGLMILCVCSAYGIVSITKSGRRIRAVAKWYRAEMKITNGDNPAIFELKRILSEDGYKEYELWRGILALIIGISIPTWVFIVPMVLASFI